MLRGLVASLVAHTSRFIEPALRVSSISDPSQAQVGEVVTVRTENPLVETMGFEPTTSGLQSPRSTN